MLLRDTVKVGVRFRVRVKVGFKLAILWSPLRALLHQTQQHVYEVKN